MKQIKLIILAVVAIGALVVAAPAAAKSRDRNHDRIPDRWERAHHLSLKVKQARRDQDHDGLRNRGEFRAQTDPRDDDSDNDGVEDGDERAGTVASYSGGVLTINLFGGGSVTGQVTADTEIECDNGDDGSNEGDGRSEDRAFRHDSGDGEDSGGGDGEGEDSGGRSEGSDEHGDDHQSCPADALKEGAVVQEAELKLANGQAVFKDIEISD